MMMTQISLDEILAGPAPEPCVNCEGDAAANWLLCLACVAVINETMLIDLAKKHGEYEQWCAKAEMFLRDLPAGDPAFAPGWEMWRLRKRVYERITWLGRAVKAAA